MGKNFSISKLTSFLQYCFGKSKIKSEPIIAENVIPFVRKTSDNAEQKVTSKQIVTYNKKYNKITQPIKRAELPQTSARQDIDERIPAQAAAHDKVEFLDVSPEALKELEHNFNEKKTKVQQLILSNSDLIPKEFIKTVKTVKTPEELALVIRMYPKIASLNLDIKHSANVQRFLKTKVISLKGQQDLFKDETRVCDIAIELIKAVTEPSKDPKVIAIEDYLKTRYNMDFVHLENMEEAKRILKTVMLAKKHNIPLPKNIIISPYSTATSSGTNYAHSPQSFSVVLKSQKEDETISELAIS